MQKERRTTLVLGDNCEPERFEQFLQQRAWTRIARDVKDDSAAVRHAVIQSLLFTNWKQGAEILDAMAANDPSEDQREFAAQSADPLRWGQAGP